MRLLCFLVLGCVWAAPVTGQEEGRKRGKRVEADDGMAKTRRPGGVNELFTVKQFKGADGKVLDYSLFVPAGATKGLPLVLCLHGKGGGTGAANVLAAPEQQARHACLVLAPAAGPGTRWVPGKIHEKLDSMPSVMPLLMEALEAVMVETKADRKRIYVTGQSMGGFGTWGLMAHHADWFAAAAPVCGAWLVEDVEKMKGVPVWAFHGAQDNTVPVEGSRRMIAALQAAGAEPKYTEYPDVGHNSWTRAYAEAELWDWMFRQRRP